MRFVALHKAGILSTAKHLIVGAVVEIMIYANICIWCQQVAELLGLSLQQGNKAAPPPTPSHKTLLFVPLGTFPGYSVSCEAELTEPGPQQAASVHATCWLCCYLLLPEDVVLLPLECFQAWALLLLRALPMWPIVFLWPPSHSLLLVSCSCRVSWDMPGSAKGKDLLCTKLCPPRFPLWKPYLETGPSVGT